MNANAGASAGASAGAALAAHWPGPTPPYAPAAVARLEDLAVVRLSGSDLRAFLARQLTCDTAALARGHALTGAWLNPKGRALTLLTLIAPPAGDGLLAVLPATLATGVLQRMRLFVMRDDVRIEPDDRLAAAGLIGDAVRTAGHTIGDAAAPVLARLPGEGERALLVGAPAELDRVTAACTSAGAAADATVWRLHQIAAGTPELLPGNQEEFIPQMLNLNRLGAVSFTKGCYPGQEIVARTHHLGRIKRRMFRALAPGARVPEPGTAVVAGSGGAAGRVVMAARAADGTPHLLVVLSLDAAAQPLHLGDAEGPALQIVAPPYPLAG